MANQTPKPQRKLRNYLLDPSLQLKFALYSVAVAVLVAGLVGTFLFRTTRTLFHEMDLAVQARASAAETSKELGTTALSNELMQNLDDPAFEAELKKKSAEIDAKYEAEKNAIIEQKKNLERKQRAFNIGLGAALAAFAFLSFLASIVLTHRVAGPLLRIRRIIGEVESGKYVPPAYGLRPGDELREMFDELIKMVAALKIRREEAIAGVKAAMEGASPDVQAKLQDVVNKLEATKGEPPGV